MNYKNTLLFLFLLSLCAGVFSQTLSPSVVASSGSEGTSESYHMAWTLGETVVGTLSAEDLMLSQGFHQGELIVTSIEVNMPGQQLLAYPDPARDIVYLQADNPEGMRYMIFDMNGRLIRNEPLTGKITEVMVSDLQPSTYFIKLTEGQREVQTFKIVKK